MTSPAPELGRDPAHDTTAPAERRAARETGESLPDLPPVPRIAIHAFCATPEIAATIEAVARDRRLARAHVSVHDGDVATAIEAYRHEVTPDLIVLESRAAGETLLAQLDELAAVCVARTKVMVIGHCNDIVLYRAVLDRDVSDYLLAPVDEVTVIAAISRLYRGSAARKPGKAIAFVGAKGGVGASTIAHNVAWSIGRSLSAEVILADMDLPFGTAGLDFNVEQRTGIAEALEDIEGLDELKLERLLAKYDDHLRLLGAPAALARAYDFDEGAFDRIVEIAQASAPFVVLDLPHLWTSWARRLLLGADEVVIVTEPDLAGLRNTKNMVELLQQARPNDAPPKLILNRVGMPKRPEIKAEEFADALDLAPIASLAFDPMLFGTAANNGQMIGEASAKAKVAGVFADVAQIVTGQKPVAGGRRRGFGLERLWKT